MLLRHHRRFPWSAFALAFPLFLADMAPPFGCGACGGSSERPPQETDSSGTDAATDADDNDDANDATTASATGTDSGDAEAAE